MYTRPIEVNSMIVQWQWLSVFATFALLSPLIASLCFVCLRASQKWTMLAYFKNHWLRVRVLTCSSQHRQEPANSFPASKP